MTALPSLLRQSFANFVEGLTVAIPRLFSGQPRWIHDVPEEAPADAKSPTAVDGTPGAD